ncbi:MAG: pyridoxine 5'-phosphate synthase [Proteobacteria bacterium]|nr:pyridoxine 5'-phosphate synthase [Pseudomonadota bacterium]
MKFSLNLNKIALLRNARGENYPSLEEYANKAIELGVDGLTLHPRPDHRHATSDDVISLAKITRDRGVEFNIEGNPFSEPSESFKGYVNLVNKCQPDQATLVPDLPNQITSDHGWESGDHDDDLIKLINNLNNLCQNTSISLFVDNLKNKDTNIDAIDYALKVNANTIEIHTGEFSKLIDKKDFTINAKLEELIYTAKEKNLMVNAGHDLNLSNLPHLVKIGGVNEVSIGHAIIVDALNYGFEDTIKRYIEVIKG